MKHCKYLIKIPLILMSAIVISILPIAYMSVYAEGIEYYKNLPEYDPYYIHPGTPDTSEKGRFFNESWWLNENYRLIVYGSPSDLKGNDFKNGEYRYLGYDNVDNPFTNDRFPDDKVGGTAPQNRSWIYEPWKHPYYICIATNYSRNIDCQPDIDRMAQSLGWTPNGSGTFYGYINVQSYPSLLAKGSGTMYHDTYGSVYYDTQIIPTLPARRFETGMSMTVDSPATVSIASDENTVTVPVSISVCLLDDTWYSDEVQKALHYTRDDIDKWIFTLSFKGKEYSKSITGTGGNSMSHNFNIDFSRNEITDGENVSFTGRADIIYHNDVENSDADIDTTAFNVEASLPGTPISAILELPEQAGINETFTILNRSVIPAGHNVISQTLEKSVNGGSYINAGWDTVSKTDTAAAKCNISYRLTIEADTGSYTDAKSIEIIDLSNSSVSAAISAPSHVYEDTPFSVSNSSMVSYGDVRESFISAYAKGGYGYSWDKEDCEGSLSFDGGTLIKSLVSEETEEVILQLTVNDDKGHFDTAMKIIKVHSLPVSRIKISGSLKENRKVIIKSEPIEHPDYPIVNTLIDVIPVSEVASSDIKKSALSSDEEAYYLFKSAGTYKVRITVTDSRGRQHLKEQEIIIEADENPVADFDVVNTILREPENDSKAIIKIGDKSYSSDGDKIIQRIYRYKYDSDNDGSFSDENYVTISNGNEKEVTIETENVGKYYINLSVKESFGQDTLPEFISDSDYKTDNTDEMSQYNAVVEVINVAPSVAAEGKTKAKVDIRFIVDESLKSELENNMARFEANLIANDLDYDITVDEVAEEGRNSYEILGNMSYLSLNSDNWDYNALDFSMGKRYGYIYTNDSGKLTLIMEDIEGVYTKKFDTNITIQLEDIYTHKVYTDIKNDSVYVLILNTSNGCLEYFGIDIENESVLFNESIYIREPEYSSLDFYEEVFYEEEEIIETAIVSRGSSGYYMRKVVLDVTTGSLIYNTRFNISLRKYGGYNLYYNDYFDKFFLGISYLTNKAYFTRLEDEEDTGCRPEKDDTIYIDEYNSSGTIIYSKRFRNSSYEEIVFKEDTILMYRGYIYLGVSDVNWTEKSGGGYTVSSVDRFFKYNVNDRTSTYKSIDYSGDDTSYNIEDNILILYDVNEEYGSGDDLKQYYKFYDLENLSLIDSFDTQDGWNTDEDRCDQRGIWLVDDYIYVGYNIRDYSKRGTNQEYSHYLVVRKNGSAVTKYRIAQSKDYSAFFFPTSNWGYFVSGSNFDIYNYSLPFSSVLNREMASESFREESANFTVLMLDSKVYEEGAYHDSYLINQSDSDYVVITSSDSSLQQYKSILQSKSDVDTINLSLNMGVNLDNIFNTISSGGNLNQIAAKAVLLGEEITFESQYSDYENDPQYSSGSWKYTHDTYFQNSQGISEYHNKTYSTPISNFDKIGKYTILARVRDNPKNDSRFSNYRLYSSSANTMDLYVHRRPIINRVSVEAVNSSDVISPGRFKKNSLLRLSFNAYDPDWQYNPDKGIKGYDFSLSGAVKEDFSNNEYFTVTTEGEITLTLKIKDEFGVKSLPADTTFTIGNETAAANLQPIAWFDTPERIYTRQDLPIEFDYYDVDGSINSVTWEIDGSTVNKNLIESGGYSFENTGLHHISLTVRDNDNETTVIEKYINVDSTEPKGVLNISGSLKQNRKITLDILNSVKDVFDIDFTNTQWLFTPISGGNSSDIRFKTISDTRKDILFKEPGTYRVDIKIFDVNSNYCEISEELNIVEDIAPVLGIDCAQTAVRNTDVEITIDTQSTDDYIESIKYYSIYDSDNDGDFFDEAVIYLSEYDDMNSIQVPFDNIGKYILRVNVQEGFLEETIPEFIVYEDYLCTLMQHEINVDNMAPIVDFYTDNDVYIVNEPIIYKSVITGGNAIQNSDLYTDSEKDSIYDFKWSVTHDPSVMPDPDSLSMYNGVEQEDMFISFDRAGEYTINAWAVDDPKAGDIRFNNYRKQSSTASKTITVHRKPAAGLSFNAISNLTETDPVNYVFGGNTFLEGTSLRINDASYDPDGYSVSSVIEWKKQGGSYEEISSGDTLIFNETGQYIFRINTRDNYGSRDTEIFILNIVEDMELLPEIIPQTVPASESFLLRLTTNTLAANARVDIQSTGIPLALVSDNGIKRVWEADYTTSEILPDNNYTAAFFARSIQGYEMMRDKAYTVSTPVNLFPAMPSKVCAGDNVIIEARTSKYAEEVFVTLFKGEAFEETINMTGQIIGNEKQWSGYYTIPDVDDGVYQARFTASTPNGNSETAIIDFSIESLSITGVTIEGYWNHWRGQINMFGEQMTDEPHRFLSLECVKINVWTSGYADKVIIRFSPELEAMQFIDPFNNLYDYVDDFPGIEEYVYFPSDSTFMQDDSQKDSHVYWEYILPLADSTQDLENNRLGEPYKMTVYAYKDEDFVMYEIDDIDITGNVYDHIFIQPLN